MIYGNLYSVERDLSSVTLLKHILIFWKMGNKIISHWLFHGNKVCLFPSKWSDCKVNISNWWSEHGLIMHLRSSQFQGQWCHLLLLVLLKTHFTEGRTSKFIINFFWFFQSTSTCGIITDPIISIKEHPTWQMPRTSRAASHISNLWVCQHSAP